MSELDKDDIRAAVRAGILTEAQAASTLALADSRRGMRENLDGLDEPFELFRGFNEIFVVVGLGILYMGYVGLFTATAGSLKILVAGLVGLLPIALLSRYFIVNRRMVAPAIALSLMTAGLGFMIGFALADVIDISYAAEAAVATAVIAVVMVGFWWIFHVPFALALIALAIYAFAFSLFGIGSAELETISEIFLLSAGGPFSIITIVLGLVGLAIALRFDLSDPHRVTRRSANAFWLHVIAAPAITNTIAATLFDAGTIAAQALLLVFVLTMALFAIIIDRRSFLIAGIGYLVALAFRGEETSAFLIVLILGVLLVTLGAKWEAIRRWIMTRLPDFPGKTRLAPWGQDQRPKDNA